MNVAAVHPGQFVGASIITPGEWAELDLDPATRHRSISRAVRQAATRDPALASRAPRLLALLDDVVRRAEEGGAFYCASLVLSKAGVIGTASSAGVAGAAGAVGVAGVAGVAGVLVATVLMQVSSSTGPGPHLAADEICAGIAASISCDPDWAGADVALVTLPGVGIAVRAEVAADGVCVQYLVPVPSEGRVVVLTFTSPSAPYATALVELFDSMATGFRLTYEPTSDTDCAEDGAVVQLNRRVGPSG